MVRFRCELDSASMAMRLAICLLLGLRVVHASLCQNSPMLSGRYGADLHHEANSTTVITDKQHSGIQPVAGDYGSEQGTSSPPKGQAKQDLAETNSDSTPELDGPSSPPSTTSSTNGALSQTTPASNTSNEATVTSDSSSSSSVSAPDLSSSNSLASGNPSSQGLTSSTPSALPNTQFGVAPNITSISSPDNSTNSSTSSPSTPPPPPSSTAELQQPSHSSSHTKSIAAGITVPVGIIALGLVALVVLHKRRQQTKISKGHELNGGGKDEEKAVETQMEPSAAQAGTRRVTMEEVESGSNEHFESEAAATGKKVEVGNFGGRGSDEGSHASRSTVRFQLDETAQITPAEEQASDSGKANRPTTIGKPALARARSKRKPVPALLDPIDDQPAAT